VPQSTRNHHRPADPEPERRPQGGFTLIELMAVIAIMAMIFAIGAPRIGSSKWRALRDEAESIATSIEFARQRAVMTGTPHRLLIDLEDGGYRIEWLVSEEEALAAILGDESPSSDASGLTEGLGAALGSALDGEDPLGAQDPIDLRPPARAERDFYPIPNRQLGSFSWIDDALYFVGLDGSGGWIESGQVALFFESDGTTEYAQLEIADADDNHMTLEIEPLLDRVRRRNGTARS
jgi:prepilin-type N-terminal cleavage/methylation domain-containing protein